MKQRLTARFVQTVKPTSKTKRYWDSDGTGLGLAVKPSGSKSYLQRITIRGKVRDIGLGSTIENTLAQVRQVARQHHLVARSGGDPTQAKQEQAAIPTFKEAARAVVEIRRPGWRNAKHPKDWISSLDRHAPQLKGMLVSEILPQHVLEVLNPIWHSRPETARRVRQRIGAVMLWAVAQGYRTDNPAGECMKYMLPKQNEQRTHFKALHYNQVADAVKQVQEKTQAYMSTILCFEFIVFTAARSGEARLAQWNEIDLDTATWTIPANRMKANRKHKVPLSKRAMQVLEQAWQLNMGAGFVFPSIRGKALTDSTISKLLRENGIQSTVHGFRSSFRDWCAEKTNVPSAVAEMALAHVNKDRVEAAYRRTDFFEQRIKLMDLWAQYLTTEPGKVLTLPNVQHYNGTRSD